MHPIHIGFQMDKLAYCGLYCAQCSYKRAHDDNDTTHLHSIPYTTTFQELSAYNCDGCKGANCICGICKIKPCAVEKGIHSCAECGDFPCALIVAFENDGIPHHKTAIENLNSIKQNGVDHWFAHIMPSLQCEICGAPQSWYVTCDKH